MQPNEDETFYVLEGDLPVHVDGEEITASAGSTVYIPRGTPHSFRVDSETARLLVLNTPAGHERFFRAMGEPAAERTLPPPPEGPPDMDAMTRAAEDAGFPSSAHHRSEPVVRLVSALPVPARARPRRGALGGTDGACGSRWRTSQC